MCPVPAQTSDPASWVARYGDELFRYALVRVQRRELAEDLVQETLLVGLSSRGSFRGDAPEIAWLKGILKHKVADHFRRLAKEAPGEQDDTVEALFTQPGSWRQPPQAWTTEGPEASAENMEFWNILTRCLAALPPGLAAAFVLREIDGTRTEDACKILGITATNLWVRLHRARLRLRQCLEVHWFGSSRAP